MEKLDASQFQGLLVGQFIASATGAILLALSNFGGFYYMNYYAGFEVWGYIYLGSGVLVSILILAGIAGLVVALMAIVNSLNAKENVTADLLRQNALKAMKGAGFTVSLAVLGAIIFAIDSMIEETDWWLSGGFYGAFIGGLLTVYFGKLILERLGE